MEPNDQELLDRMGHLRAMLDEAAGAVMAGDLDQAQRHMLMNWLSDLSAGPGPQALYLTVPHGAKPQPAVIKCDQCDGYRLRS